MGAEICKYPLFGCIVARIQLHGEVTEGKGKWSRPVPGSGFRNLDAQEEFSAPAKPSRSHSGWVFSEGVCGFVQRGESASCWRTECVGEMHYHTIFLACVGVSCIWPAFRALAETGLPCLDKGAWIAGKREPAALPQGERGLHHEGFIWRERLRGRSLAAECALLRAIGKPREHLRSPLNFYRSQATNWPVRAVKRPSQPRRGEPGCHLRFRPPRSQMFQSPLYPSTSKQRNPSFPRGEAKRGCHSGQSSRN